MEYTVKSMEQYLDESEDILEHFVYTTQEGIPTAIDVKFTNGKVEAITASELYLVFKNKSVVTYKEWVKYKVVKAL